MEQLSQAEIRMMDSILSGDPDRANSFAFWDSPQLAKWFSSKGYALHERVTTGDEQQKTPYTRPKLPCADFCQSAYPYAHYDARVEADIGFDNCLHGHTISDRVFYAQDSQHRHVAIKMTRVGSDEYRILRFLSQLSMDVQRENCILPILDLIYLRDACFAVMPRWGEDIHRPNSHTLRDILRIMQSMLKAITFLHSHNIVHRDLKMDNMVVNHFGNAAADKYYYTRKSLLKGGHLIYAMIDYDVSMMLDPGVNKADVRLPCQESYIGTPNFCSDTRQGEFDYSPFAFDIGSLGVEPCDSYQHYSRDIPMLAPFFDRMVTRDVSKRFTAAQALQFLEDKVLAGATEEQLAIPEHPFDYATSKTYEYHDRWEGLSEDFKMQWAAYREPLGIPVTWRILRSIRRNEWLPYMLIPKMRLFFYRLTYLPRVVWSQFIGLLGHSSSSIHLK